MIDSIVYAVYYEFIIAVCGVDVYKRQAESGEKTFAESNQGNLGGEGAERPWCD